MKNHCNATGLTWWTERIHALKHLEYTTPRWQFQIGSQVLTSLPSVKLSIMVETRLCLAWDSHNSNENIYSTTQFFYKIFFVYTGPLKFQLGLLKEKLGAVCMHMEVVHLYITWVYYNTLVEDSHDVTSSPCIKNLQSSILNWESLISPIHYTLV